MIFWAGSAARKLLKLAFLFRSWKLGFHLGTIQPPHSLASNFLKIRLHSSSLQSAFCTKHSSGSVSGNALRFQAVCSSSTGAAGLSKDFAVPTFETSAKVNGTHYSTFKAPFRTAWWRSSVHSPTVASCASKRPRMPNSFTSAKEGFGYAPCY